jgi:hypothetical protein
MLGHSTCFLVRLPNFKLLRNQCLLQFLIPSLLSPYLLLLLLGLFRQKVLSLVIVVLIDLLKILAMCFLVNHKFQFYLTINHHLFYLQLQLFKTHLLRKLRHSLLRKSLDKSIAISLLLCYNENIIL